MPRCGANVKILRLCTRRSSGLYVKPGGAPGYRRCPRIPEVLLRVTLPRRHDDLDGLAGFERPMLPFEPDAAKGVTNFAARIGDAECDLTGAKAAMEVGEQFGSGQIDLRYRPERKNDEPDRFGSRLQNLEDPLPDELDVEVEQRRFTPDDENVRAAPLSPDGGNDRRTRPCLELAPVQRLAAAMPGEAAARSRWRRREGRR